MLTGVNPDSFLLRAWFEPREMAGAEPEFRAQVEHLSTGEREFVTTFAAIERFVVKIIEADASQ